MSAPQKSKPSQFLSVGWTAASPATHSDSAEQEKSAKFFGKMVGLSPSFQREFKALDLSTVHDENPLHKRLSLRKAHGHPYESESESVEELRRKVEINPPKYLSDNEYFKLSRFLCNVLSKKEIEELSPQILRRFAKQAIKDVKYIQALARKAIAEQDKIPVGIKATIVGKLFGLQEAYGTLLKDFKACKRTFACGDTVFEERVVLNPTDRTGCYSILTRRTDMVVELKNRWKQLIRAMDQLRAKMPAPSECCPALVVPNMNLADFPEKMPVDQRRKIENACLRLKALQTCIGEMEENWGVLKSMIQKGEIPSYVKADTVNFHVCLPNQAKPLPPSYDISNLATDMSSTGMSREVVQEKAAPTMTSQWIISKESEPSDLDPKKDYFSDSVSAEAQNKKLDREDTNKRKAAKKSKEEISLSVPPDIVVSVNPKPAGYFEVQPVLHDLLEQVTDKGRLLVRQTKQPVDDLIVSVAGKKELTEDQYALFMQYYETMQKSIEMWKKHFPSIQEVYDYIYAEDSVLKKGVRAVLAEAVKGIHMLQYPAEKKQKPFERRTSDLALSIKSTSRMHRRGSLPEGLSLGKSVFRMETIPPTPTPTSSPSGSGSPRLPQSPEGVSQEDS